MIYLLPAPRIAGYLPAVCATPAPAVVPPLRPDSLNATQEEILLTALIHRDLLDAGHYAAVHPTYGQDYFAVSELTRPDALKLVLYGYLEKHPDRKLQMWYRLSELGTFRARDLRRLRDAEPLPLLPADATRQQRLEFDRRANLRRLGQELAFQGFVVLAEAGRGPLLGEIAFINVFTRHQRLYRCALGSSTWKERLAGYFPLRNPEMARQQMLLAEIPL